MNPTPNDLPLRDIHLPDGISWWPPAAGWWWLLGIILFIGITGFLAYRYYRHRLLHRAAKRELEMIQQSYVETSDSQLLVKSLSIWLRRVSLSFYPRQGVAGLTGTAWLAFLDTAFINKKRAERFSAETGVLLSHAPYQANSEIDVDGLLQLCQNWLQCLPRQGRRQP